MIIQEWKKRENEIYSQVQRASSTFLELQEDSMKKGEEFLHTFASMREKINSLSDVVLRTMDITKQTEESNLAIEQLQASLLCFCLIRLCFL